RTWGFVSVAGIVKQYVLVFRFYGPWRPPIPGGTLSLSLGSAAKETSCAVSSSVRWGYAPAMENRMTSTFWATVGMFAGTVFAADSITFHKDVEPILQKNCQICHRPGQIAPMSFLTYRDARPWAKAMKGAVASRKMPPWFADPKYGHFANDRSLKQSEIDTIVAWADAGAQEGDAKDAPAPIAWPADGWLIQPDYV